MGRFVSAFQGGDTVLTYKVVLLYTGSTRRGLTYQKG